MNSGSIDFITNLLTIELIKEKVESLVDGESISFELKSDFTVNNFQQLKEIINLGSNRKITDYDLDFFFHTFL